MKIVVIGTGFVGAVSSAVWASFGHQVVGLDVDPDKVKKLQAGKVPFYEPGLEELLVDQQKEGRLSFTTDYKKAVSGAQLVVIAVGTPSTPEGKTDLQYVLASSKSLAKHLSPQTVLAVKSTVPPGTLDQVDEVIRSQTKHTYYLASLPEFLREGSAVEDTLHPDRVVIGATDQFAIDLLKKLHQPFKAPVCVVSPESAQLAKYAANAYLATRITFINQVADLCMHNDADVTEVIKAIGLDKRIGDHYWYPGLGFGGSCFPKDVKELAFYSKQVGEEGNLLTKINQLNQERIAKLMNFFGQQVGGWRGKQVAVLGLSFKPNTNDMREAPSVGVIPWLLKEGASVKAFDPKALSVAPSFLPSDENLTYHQSLSAAVKRAQVIMVLVEWPEIINFDYSQLNQDQDGSQLASDQSSSDAKKRWFIDVRLQFEPSQVKGWGFEHLGVGRGRYKSREKSNKSSKT